MTTGYGKSGKQVYGSDEIESDRYDSRGGSRTSIIRDHKTVKSTASPVVSGPIFILKVRIPVLGAQASEVIQIRKSDVSFDVRTQNGVDVIDISGQLDAFTTPDVKAEFKKLTDARRYKLVLNLENVDYVNSTAIGAIVAVAQQVRRRKGDLKVVGMKEDIRKVFDLVGASKILEMFAAEQEAVNSFS